MANPFIPFHHGSPEYQKYINSPEWRLKNRRKIALAGYKCEWCGARNVYLVAHHLTYANVHHEDMDQDLKCLCKPCHKKAHDQRVDAYDDKWEYKSVDGWAVKWFGEKWYELLSYDEAKEGLERTLARSGMKLVRPYGVNYAKAQYQ